MDKIIKHVGVLGMRWGHRKKSSSELSDDEKSFVEAVKKNRIKKVGKVEDLNSKKIQELLSSKSMQKKFAAYKEKRKIEKIRKAARLTALTIMAVTTFGPSIYRKGQTISYFAQAKRTADTFNKYGGFDPKMVINSKFV